jgi:hypothetical protein
VRVPYRLTRCLGLLGLASLGSCTLTSQRPEPEAAVSARTEVAFPGVRVEVATATPDTIEIWGNMALFWGSYFERLAFPGQPESEQQGRFVAQWLRQADGSWLMQRLFRIPVATRVP